MPTAIGEGDVSLFRAFSPTAGKCLLPFKSLHKGRDCKDSILTPTMMSNRRAQSQGSWVIAGSDTLKEWSFGGVRRIKMAKKVMDLQDPR